MTEQKLSERMFSTVPYHPEGPSNEDEVRIIDWGRAVASLEAELKEQDRLLLAAAMKYKELEVKLEAMERALDIERLATIEHTQWMAWARVIMDEEQGLSTERRERWQAMMVDYSELPEKIKDYDREWARIIIGDALAAAQEEQSNV